MKSNAASFERIRVFIRMSLERSQYHLREQVGSESNLQLKIVTHPLTRMVLTSLCKIKFHGAADEIHH
jgi:hypothetical protein